MTNDAINWKTVKIPEAVRDDAQEDPRTYGEIMRAGLDEDTEQVQEQLYREELEAINDKLQTIEGAQGGTVNKALEIGEHHDKRVQDRLTELNNQLDRIEAAAKEATNAAQNAERAAEELGGQR
ncbi:hypothetical protein OSG_eHP10_00175 [environmental Halophage eHP-10]|nr:hypothetical protein OSG_eHP10_00175 [environmental Halophage eHP-10]